MSHSNRSRPQTGGAVIGFAVACAITACAVAADTAARAQLLKAADLPSIVELPKPQAAIPLPDGDDPVTIHLSQAPAGTFTVRRVSAGDGKLYLDLRAENAPLTGTAEVSHGGKQIRQTINGELWLSLSPRIGRLTIHVFTPGTKDPVELITPTTLVEIRGRQIYLNNEPFLMKGVMSRNLTDRDAAYVHSLGINTLRGLEALADCERYGFMSIVSLNFGKDASKQAVAGPDPEFQSALAKDMEWLKDNSKAAIASPNTLILQLGNEKTGAGGKPPGAEPLTRPRRHVSQLLAAAYNVIKPLSPMLPTGYANQDLGYLAPDCMDVYMHNSYLAKDRYNYPWDDFMKWQGCLPPDGPTGEGRPFVNSEFGANRYLCQSYHGGPNNPFLEKIHAWNLPCRWTEFMQHGTAGGAIYCLYDLEHPQDQGCSCFGILTFDGQPKLACWEVAHLWRDFDVELRGTDLLISYKRDYQARDCQLTLTTTDGKSTTHHLDDFKPQSTQTIPLKDLSLSNPTEFRWTLDFTSHAGLVNQACGACPTKLEEHDFLDRLKVRDTYPFLRELFDAQVVTSNGTPAPLTLAEMARPDGIIPIALRKPNGVTYLLLISRENPNEPAPPHASTTESSTPGQSASDHSAAPDSSPHTAPHEPRGPLRNNLTLDVPFQGKVELVDDMTGQPLPQPVHSTPIPGGLRLTNLQAARIPNLIRDRSDKPFKLPIYRISP